MIDSIPQRPRSVPSGGSLLRSVFFHPMLVLSLLLHGAFLFVPLPTPSEPVPEAEELEEEPVELSLESLIAPPPAPSPSPQPAPPQPAATVTVTPAPVPQAQPIYTPPPQAQPQPTPEAAAPAAVPTVEANPAAEAVAAEPAPVEDSPFDPLPLQAAFASGLEGMDGDLTAQGIAPSPITFAEPEQFFTSRSVSADPLPGIHQMRWLNDRRAEDVSTELQQRYAGSEMTFVEVPGGYGGGQLFAIQNPEGQTFFYLNIVPGKGGASTVLVVWGHNPNEPTPTAPAAM